MKKYGMSCTTLSNTGNNKKHIKHQHPDNIQLTKSIQKQQHPDDTHCLPNTQNHNRRRREKRLAPSISTKQPQRKTPNMMPQLPPVNVKNLLQCGGSGGRRPPSAVPAAARVHGQCRRWASGMKSCMGRGARVHIQPLVGGGLSVQLRVCGADVGDGEFREELLVVDGGVGLVCVARQAGPVPSFVVVRIWIRRGRRTGRMGVRRS